ncbi:hypothetical protein ACFXGA_12410 [Actinosynnema sp. NPDC059335]|uniref:hypothetical protein n=1 Tax=Actinosynnema sp. NPDC059335 TaxID=3346804 RepID=UPI0036718900
MQPPRWAVWVARAVAVVVVVPVRVAWEGLKVAGRAVRRFLLRPLGVVLAWVWDGVRAVCRFLWHRMFTPVGHGLRWCGGVLVRFVLRPLRVAVRWLAGWVGRGVAVVFDGVRRALRAVARFALRPAGRGLRRLLRPVGRWSRRAGAVVGRFLRAVLLRPLAWCWHNVVVRGLRALGAGLWWLARLFGEALWWAFRVVGRALRAVGRVIGDAVAWAWRLLARAFRAVVVTPVRWLWRVAVAPVGRLLGRVWRAVVVAPARWVRASVVAPVRLAGRRVGAQLRALLGVRRG